MSRHMQAPAKEHWAAAKQILRYVRGTLEYGCCYKGGRDAVLIGYSDSNHTGDINDKKSTSGIIFFLDGNM
jgi:hypothetical protein